MWRESNSHYFLAVLSGGGGVTGAPHRHGQEASVMGENARKAIEMCRS